MKFHYILLGLLAAISMIVIRSIYVVNVVINDELDSENHNPIQIDQHDDNAWGHIYPSRVWCSVLTMFLNNEKGLCPED